MDYRVDLAALDTVVERMARFDAHVDAVLADVDARTRALDAEWTGRAADGHGAAQRRWTAAAGQMRSALDGLRDVVATARSNYAAALAAGRSMWG